MKVYSLTPEDVVRARAFLKANNHHIDPHIDHESLVKMANQYKQDLIKRQHGGGK